MSDHQKYIFPILTALVIAILPLLGRLPVWVILWCTVMWGYMLCSLKYHLPWPEKGMRRLLAIAGIIGLIITFSNKKLGADAYIGLLAVMAAIKPFEIMSHRDRMMTIFLAYFMVITSLLQSESLIITLYMLFSVCITTAALIRINDPYGRFQENMKLSALIMTQAIPLMILLFFLFPRVQGSLFGLSVSGRGTSGFTDTLRPGSVSRLVENQDVVFRASFDGPIPPPHLRYWRGIVFHTFDGRRWRHTNDLKEKFLLPEGDNPVSYRVTLEPNKNQWLFALEMPAEIPRSVKFYEDYTLRSRRKIIRKMSYSITSNTRYQADEGVRADHQRAIGLPEKGNPRARNLAKQLTKNAKDVDEKVDRILSYIKDNGFRYTLKPPLLGRHTVDDFLFDSKSGYCEHYASAFAFMMRAIDVPARIVGGYLGGEINPFGNYLLVRQSDAHVWVEIWHPKDGWKRIDPTAVVVPDRISRGLEGALLPSELPDYLSRKYLGGLSSYVIRIRLGWDAVSTQWVAWFSGYSYSEQMALLEKFGITIDTWVSSFKVLMMLLVLIMMIVGLYSVFVFKPSRRKPDKIRQGYVLFCKKLSRAGLLRKSDMGPSEYAAYVFKNRPDLKSAVDDITDLYIRLRYQPDHQPNHKTDPPAEALKTFRRKVKVFKTR